jgi:zinc transport system substrate-binding protein
MMEAALVIKKFLIEVSPEDAAFFEQNCRSLLDEITALDARLTEELKPLAGSVFCVYHQAFGYFAQNYGLQQMVVEAGGKEPSPRRVEALIRRAQGEGVRVIFVQPQFSRTAAEIIARAIGGSAAAIDPLAYDWPTNMELMAKTVAAALGNTL